MDQIHMWKILLKGSCTYVSVCKVSIQGPTNIGTEKLHKVNEATICQIHI